VVYKPDSVRGAIVVPTCIETFARAARWSFL